VGKALKGSRTTVENEGEGEKCGSRVFPGIRPGIFHHPAPNFRFEPRDFTGIYVHSKYGFAVRPSSFDSRTPFNKIASKSARLHYVNERLTEHAP
jgi:hypothetical protein